MRYGSHTRGATVHRGQDGDTPRRPPRRGGTVDATSGALLRAGLLTTGLLLALFAVGLSPVGGQERPEPGALTGTVRTPTGEPAPDARVLLTGTDHATTVDGDGRFALRGVPAGEYVLDARSDAYGRAAASVRVEPSGTSHVEVVLSPLFEEAELFVSLGPEARRGDELFGAAQALSGRELEERSRGTLGETLAREPGVTSTYFGPGASRPVIRGMGGDRIRVLSNGLDVADTSDDGPDHDVAVEPGLADRIEIIRGPATLLYGGSAIGGAVNVVDGRIPREPAGRLPTGTVRFQGASVADARDAAVRLTGGVGPLAWNVEGLVRRTGDYRIPAGDGGQEGDGHGHGHGTEGEDRPGVLENSAVETARLALGLSYVGESGHLGISWTAHESEYGVPGHSHAGLGEQAAGAAPAPRAPSELAPDRGSGGARDRIFAREGGHGHGDEGVVVDLRQRSVDLEGARTFARGPLGSGRVRLGYADRRDDEIEGTVLGTRKTNERWEARLETTHRPLGGLTGTWGVQYGQRDFTSEGIEAFVPPTRSERWALFAVEEYRATEALRLQLGSRYEVREVTDRSTSTAVRRSGVSTSAGLNWTVEEGLTLALSASRSLKLPSPEELFSDGPHLATHQFEVGDPALGRERASSLDATVRTRLGRLRGELSGFLNRFDGFIFLDETGEETLGLPVLEYRQEDARFLGFEAHAEVGILERFPGRTALELRADWVRARLTASRRPLPRIPPSTVGGGVRHEGERWWGRVGLHRANRQGRVGPLEEPTPGHTLVDASLGYRHPWRGVVHEVALEGTNLTDEFARSHTSFLRDEAPLPGRDLRLTYRLRF